MGELWKAVQWVFLGEYSWACSACYAWRMSCDESGCNLIATENGKFQKICLLQANFLPPSLTPKGFIPIRESLQALVFIPKTLLWLVLAVCFYLLRMVREQRWERGQREDAWSVKYTSICCSQSQCCSPKRAIENSNAFKWNCNGSRNCCKLHMLSCVESSHTCLIRTYIFRLRSPSNIYS